MPVISMFYGIVVSLYFMDTHLAWMEIHKEELVADWELAVNGETAFKIDPLK